MIHDMNDLPSVAGYLHRVGAEPRSLRTAVIKETHGAYWLDIATLRLDIKTGIFDAPPNYEPTEDEAVRIKSEVLGAVWPTSQPLGKNFALPPELQGVDPELLYELKDAQGNVLMIQQRTTDPKTGDKRYKPWTFWSDQRWRSMEPDGPLPLFGLETIGSQTTVFIHEGPKSARRMQRLVNPKTSADKKALAEHPWGLELQAAAHIGWIGGALSPQRTDWSMLHKMGVKRAYIVADNDSPGKSAIPRISKQLKGLIVFSIEFTEMWPVSFDLGDDFPAKFFRNLNGAKHYVGPRFRDCQHPATWATDMVPNPAGKGRPVPVLRKEFADLWVWVEDTDTYICKEMPEIHRGLGQFNGLTSAFSGTQGVGQLLQRNYKGRTMRLCYRPDITARIVTDRTSSAINLHTPSLIRPAEGSTAPWEEFLAYLIPLEEERNHLKRWCATLIAHPEIRMLWGILLVSERQGMGKTTLGERILAPLVGIQNASFPGEKDILDSNFNGWAANKRLAVVGEVYAGHSFKAYNNLKNYITDKMIQVNEKFMRGYDTENWLHILACSNSKKALRMEETDRRWFFPKLNEIPWKREKWEEFYNWLESGGLQIIARWAHEHGDYCVPGEAPPMTTNKKALINESKGEVLINWCEILDAVVEEELPVVFALNEAKDAMRKSHGKVFESPLQFRKEAVARGWYAPNDMRIGVDGALSYVVVAPAAAQAIEDARRQMEQMIEAGDEPKKALKVYREAIVQRVQRVSQRMAAQF